MDRVESHRRIESALSIFVVAAVLGAVGESLAWGADATTWWLMQRGSTAFRVAELSLLWSWTGALASVTTLGLVIGLWRVSRSFVRGAARRLACGALAIFVVTLVLSMAWGLASSWLVRRSGGLSYQSLIAGFRVVHIALAVIGPGLLLATLIALARMSAEGARTAWGGRIVVAGLGVLLQIGWDMFGPVWLFPWPVLAALAGTLVAAASAGTLLALVLPVRRLWRAHRHEPLEAGIEGVYRRAEDAPATSWRDAPELRIAGAGLAEVRQRVISLVVVVLVAVPVTWTVTAARSVTGTWTLLVVLAAVQLAIAVRLTLGMARYTRAPAELPGRALGIAALLCQAAAIVGSTRLLIGMLVSFVARDLSLAQPGANLGPSVASLFGTVLLIASLRRAARGLEDAETQRRAGVALAIYLVTIGVLVSIGIAVACQRAQSLEFLGWVLPVLGLVGVACMVVYLRLLASAVHMAGWKLALEPLTPPPP